MDRARKINSAILSSINTVIGWNANRDYIYYCGWVHPATRAIARATPNLDPIVHLTFIKANADKVYIIFFLTEKSKSYDFINLVAFSS